MEKIIVKERRTKTQIFFEVITAVIDDTQNNESVSPTRIQLKCKTSYDKLTKYLEEMEKRGMIEKEKSITVKERRTKTQIFFEVITAVIDDAQNNESVSPTRVQNKCNTSYDKLTKYLEEMEKRGMIEKEKSIIVTERGMEFHKDYSRINDLINEMNEKF